MTWVRRAAVAVLCGLAAGAVATVPSQAAAAGLTVPPGQVLGWGGLYLGYVGTGEKSPLTRPTAVSALPDAVQVEPGGMFVLALRADGSVWSWGQGGTASLGHPFWHSLQLPRKVDQVAGVVDIAAGWHHSVALRSDGTVWVWGTNDDGQLGDGSTRRSLLPKQVPGLSDVVDVEAGTYSTYVRRRDGSVWVWGSNASGELGTGQIGSDQTRPVQAPALSGSVQLAGGSSQAYARRADGTVLGWGHNYDGRLAVGSSAETVPTPSVVLGADAVTHLAVGGSHALAARRDGTLLAWGSNYQGQLGVGRGKEPRGVVQVPGVTGAARVAAGAVHSIVGRSDGTVLAFGNSDNGQLGFGTRSTIYRPAVVPGLSRVRAVSTGHYMFSYAIQHPAGVS